MITICHVSSVHNGTDVRIFEKECTSLAKAGYNVKIIANGESYKKNNVEVFGMGQPPEGRLNRAFSYSDKVIKKAIGVDADIYHLHDPELLRFAKQLKKKGKIVIYDSHEDTISDINRKEYIPTILRKTIATILNIFFKTTLKKVDGIVTVTPDLVNKLSKYNKNICMVTNYPIVDRYECEKKQEIKQELTKLFFAGGISSMWSHEIILESIKDIANIEYILYGPTEIGYLDSLKKHDSWGKVDYRGRVPFHTVDKAMWQADIGIAVMQYIRGEDKTGTLGNTKLFEIMLHKLPVIATDYILWKEIIEKYNCGICVNPNDSEQIKNAILYLINNPKEAMEMGENGRKAVLAKFNWATQEKVLFDFYEKLIKDR